MNANDYQQLAGRTLLKEPDQNANELEWCLLFNSLRQAVQAGKTVERLKKQICHRQGLNLTDAVNGIGIFHTPYPRSITPEQYMVVWNLMGLIGEAAELTEFFLQHLADRNEMPVAQMMNKRMVGKEIGDVEWYVAALCTKFELLLGDVMSDNIEKLKARYPEGYTSKDSTNREGLAE